MPRYISTPVLFLSTHCFYENNGENNMEQEACFEDGDDNTYSTPLCYIIIIIDDEKEDDDDEDDAYNIINPVVILLILDTDA